MWTGSRLPTSTDIPTAYEIYLSNVQIVTCILAAPKQLFAIGLHVFKARALQMVPRSLLGSSRRFGEACCLRLQVELVEVDHNQHIFFTSLFQCPPVPVKSP